MYLTETARYGFYLLGYKLFTSETNKVNVRFTSDVSRTAPGFILDVRSTSCDSIESIVQEIVVAAGEVLKDALTTDTESDGLYPNNARQEWKIVTDENNVNIRFQC